MAVRKSATEVVFLLWRKSLEGSGYEALGLLRLTGASTPDPCLWRLFRKAEIVSNMTTTASSGIPIAHVRWEENVRPTTVIPMAQGRERNS